MNEEQIYNRMVTEKEKYEDVFGDGWMVIAAKKIELQIKDEQPENLVNRKP